MKIYNTVVTCACYPVLIKMQLKQTRFTCFKPQIALLMESISPILSHFCFIKQPALTLTNKHKPLYNSALGTIRFSYETDTEDDL